MPNVNEAAFTQIDVATVRSWLGDGGETAFIDVREDGQETENRDEMSALKDEFQTSLEDGIVAAAAGCPVEVIKYEKA